MAASKKTIIFTPTTTNKPDKGTPGLAMDITKDLMQEFRLKGLVITEDKKQKSIHQFPLQSETSLLHFGSLPPEIKSTLHRCTETRIASFIQTIKDECGDIPEPELEEILEIKMLHFWQRQFQELRLSAFPLQWYYIRIDPMLVTTKEIKKATISNYSPSLHFDLIETSMKKLRLVVYVRVNGKSYLFQEFSQHGFLLKHKNEFFVLNPEDAVILRKFPMGYADQGKLNRDLFVQETILPLSGTHKVNLDILLEEKKISGTPQCLVRLSELSGSFLMIRIQWKYEDQIIEDIKEECSTIINQTERIIVTRNAEEESKYRDLIRASHTRFKSQAREYFYLPFSDAQKNNWFVKFYRSLTERDIPVLGMKDLTHFRYNPNLPEINIKPAKGDDESIVLQFEIRYGNEKVSLADVKKALQFQEHFILLKDGSLGIIPEEWIHKYATILRLGNIEKDKITLSNRHWSFIDHALQDASLPPMMKKSFMQRWMQHQQKPGSLYQVPSNVRAELRDYQKAGFEWLCLLDEMQWGGCLADDMGLGKTLQTISFINYLLEKYPGETHLVVCPTSLMYNWEAELKKFSPDISYCIYHGANRSNLNIDGFKGVVITSYGVVRSDIDRLQEQFFGYIILDESHTIRNPDSQTTRAVLQLNSRNRMIISGTPVQNNTMDLYAQMQFINPGIMGSRNSFREIFVNPIDKFGDSNKTNELRKLINPFLLRRTKEQVATDLPAKTEITMWCEMGEEQRRIYDEIREKYRNSLLNKVREEGVASNKVFILEGLTRLRQACNAPQLIPDYADAEVDAVKMEELVWSLQEIGEEHKTLVFSQFTGMLKRIEEKLNEQGIPYLYLDGQTRATARQDLVKEFQDSDEHRVFLISLKAGGVGLTLTAADYVYLVDPWWNPAAEQQAIDRTHRIGQQQKIFAYRMICRNSVEEKILHLQERKRILSDELISEESGLVKNLTEEDIEYLFS